MFYILIHNKTLEKSSSYTKKIKWNEKCKILSQSRGLMQILNGRQSEVYESYFDIQSKLMWIKKPINSK